MWAEEHPAHSYGPVVHVWKAGGHWNSSLGARYTVTWPLRAGLARGWWPGPGLGGELAVRISTSGLAGIDGQALIEAPWVQGRIGTTLGGGGLHEPHVHVGAFTPILQPAHWDGVPVVWREPE